jgi:quercetin dioxygenase-like cupin family protein
MVNSEEIMSENLNTGDLIDMMGARFEMVARMGANHNDTVLFRTRMAPGKLVPLHSHIDPECFYVLDGQIEAFVVNDAPEWRVVGAGQSLLLADGVRHALRNATEKTAVSSLRRAAPRLRAQLSHLRRLKTSSA